MIFNPHPHTDRYSRCATVSLERLILAKKKVRGNVITDHDHLLNEKEAVYLSRKQGFKVLPEAEKSAGVHAHILAFGVRKEIRPNSGVEETIAKIHEQEGIAAAAYPLRYVGESDRAKWRGLDCVKIPQPSLLL